MARYDKGAAAERELIKILWGKGFAVARVAGSGKNALPMPDLIALGKGRVIVFECKAWKGKYLSVSREQMHELFKWREIGDAEVFIAWKYPKKGWFFIKPEHFHSNKLYSLSFPVAQKKGLTVEVLVGEQKQLKL